MRRLNARVGAFLPTYLSVLLNLPRLLLIEPSRFQGREMIRRLAWYFSASSTRADQLPFMDLPIVCHLDPCDLVDPLGNDESVSCDELVRLLSILQPREPKIVCEIGTAGGRSAANLAANLKGASIYTVDQEARIDEAIARLEVFRSITPIVCDSMEFDCTPFRGNADAVFVDGGHDYATVLSDSRKAMEMLRPGGIIIWHDYGRHAGVTAALRWLKQTDRRYLSLVRVKGTSLAVLDCLLSVPSPRR